MNENCRTELFPKVRYSEDYAGYLVRRNSAGFQYPKATYAFMWRNYFDLSSEKHIGSVYVNYQEDPEQESFFLYIYSGRSISRRYCTEIQITRDHPLPKDLEEKLLSAFRFDCFNDSIGQAGYLLRYMNDIQPMLQCLRNRYPDINNYRNEDTLLAVLPLVMYYIWNDRESVMGITCRDEKACFIAPYLGEFHELNTKEKTAEKIIGLPGFALERYNRVFAYTDLSGLLREKQAREKIAAFFKRLPDLFDYIAFTFPATAECIQLLSERETNRGEAIDILSFIGTYAFSEERWAAYKKYLLLREQIPLGNELPEQIDLDLEEPELTPALLQTKKIHRFLVDDREYFENLFRPHSTAMFWLDKDLGEFTFRAVTTLDEMWNLSLRMHVELWQTFEQVVKGILSIVVMHQTDRPFDEDVLLGISEWRIDWTCGANKREVTDGEKDMLLLYAACQELVLRTYTFPSGFYDREFL